MSKSGSPTLPWAILCYHCMQHALHSNIEDPKLPVNLCNAAAAGLARLDYYYSKAKANHYNVVATGICLNFFIHICRYTANLQLETVLHPTLQLRFFKKLDNCHFEYDHAETIFKYVYHQYEAEHAPRSMTSSSAPTWASDSSFLLEPTMLEDGQDTYTQEHERSEYEQYVLLGQGGPGKADDPLKWWKVSCLLFLRFAYQSESHQDHEREFPIISRMA